VRATTGVLSGKTSFEVRVRDEGIVRVGVSRAGDPLELGKGDCSVGYGGTGTKVSGGKFEKFGEEFTEGDTVTCEFDVDPAKASFAVSFGVNGAPPQLAAALPLPAGAALFPHVCVKNAECRVDLAALSSLPPADTCPNPAAAPPAPAPPPPSAAPGGPLAIVLEPVRDLAEQTYECFRQLAKPLDPPVRTALLTGGVSPKETLAKLKRGEVDVLVGTVPIVHEFMRSGRIPAARARFLVLDEADQLTGPDTIDKLRGIYGLLPGRAAAGADKLQCCFFSATLHSKAVRDLAEEVCYKPTWVDLKGKESVPDTVHHCVVRVAPGAEAGGRGEVRGDGVHQKYGKPGEDLEEDLDGKARASQRIKELKPRLLLKLVERFKMEQVLVFCRTNLDCDLLEKYLVSLGGGLGKGGEFSCRVLAGMRTMQERRASLLAFKEGACRILIATDVAARGIDISGLPYVINMTLPDMSENYVHRVGRVGRAERMGLALSLVAECEERVWYCQNKKKPPQFDRR
jgi:ATP-dependent RNA helicase DDX1